MRVRSGLLALLLTAALTACGGGSSPNASDATTPSGAQTRIGSPSAPLTDVTIRCAKFQEAASRIAAAESLLYGSGGGAATLDSLAAELNALKDGAPADVQSAVDDLVGAFRTAAGLIKNPTAAGQAQLAALGKQLSADGQKITAYVVSKCAR